MSENKTTLEEIASRLQAEQIVGQACRVQVIAAASALPMYEAVKGGRTEFAYSFLPSSLIDVTTDRMMKNLSDRVQINQQTADRTLRDVMVEAGVGSFSRRTDGVLGLKPDWERMKEKFP